MKEESFTMKCLSATFTALALLLAVVLACSGPGRRQQKAPTIDKSPAMQSERRKAIDEMIEKRVFTKVERPGQLPYVYVGRNFYTITVDSKRTILGVVYAYYYDGSENTGLIRIFDGMSGKQIGTFSTELGLDLD